MSPKSRQKLTLDQLAAYQIKVPGEVSENWQDWSSELTVSVESDNEGLSITTLTGKLDQAALQGLLRRLYSLGLPLISVICIENE
jgi:hypothetical protein